MAISFGLESSVGATAMSVMMVTMIVGKFTIGWINDKAGIKAGGVTGALVGFAGLVLVLTLGANNAALFLVGAALSGFAFALIPLGNPLLTKTVFGVKDYGVILAYPTMAMKLVGSLGALFFAYLYDANKSYMLPVSISSGSFVLAIIVLYLVLRSGKKFTEMGSLN
jgi:MFS family permease